MITGAAAHVRVRGRDNAASQTACSLGLGIMALLEHRAEAMFYRGDVIDTGGAISMMVLMDWRRV
jgi:hypothetical protein